jgi:hypothetical protein
VVAARTEQEDGHDDNEELRHSAKSSRSRFGKQPTGYAHADLHQTLMRLDTLIIQYRNAKESRQWKKLQR